MSTCSPFYQLLSVIVQAGLGSKIARRAKQYGATGATIFLGRGTSRNPMLEFLHLADIRKEIVIIGVAREAADDLIAALDREFHFERPHHGILFTMNVCMAADYSSDQTPDKQGEEKKMYQAIFTIVNKGDAEIAMDAATAAGAAGGTVVHARGSGIHEQERFFLMDIEPEKEILMILSEREQVGSIVDAIKEATGIEQPGKGVLFVIDVDQAHGLRK